MKNFRENRAATVIQKGWRKHQKSNKHSLTSKSRQNYLDKVYSDFSYFPIICLLLYLA